MKTEKRNKHGRLLSETLTSKLFYIIAFCLLFDVKMITMTLTQRNIHHVHDVSPGSGAVSELSVQSVRSML